MSRDWSLEELDAAGMLVGVTDDYEYEESELQLKSGDRLFVYSDGIVEQSNPEDEQFGEKRVHEQVLKSLDKPLGECCQPLEQAVVEWSGDGPITDDLSILAIELESRWFRRALRSCAVYREIW